MPNVIFQQASENKLVVNHKMGVTVTGEWKLDSNQSNLARL